MELHRIGELVALIDAVAGVAPGPYRAHAERADGRVRRGTGVAWLALGQGAGDLIDLARSLASACPRDITSTGAPRRTPSAHLTVARRADDAVIEALRSQALGPIGAGWTVTSMRLMRSHLDGTGAHYETLHDRAL